MTATQRKAVLSSERSDWATPRALFATLDQEFGFGLDVCGTAENSPCTRYLHFDALTIAWHAIARGQPLWMNPPYGTGIGKWIEKAYRESRLGCTIVCLLPSRTCTSWFHDYCLKASEIRFLRGRLCFDDNPRKRAPFPSMIVVFRPGPQTQSPNHTQPGNVAVSGGKEEA